MIRLAAIITMVIDHLGLVLFPDSLWPRLVGRLAMPLYAYGIARGFFCCRKHGTLKRYACILFITAVVCTMPYIWMSGTASLNICWTWLISLGLLVLLTSARHSILIGILTAVISAGACVLLYFIHYDYGMYGVLMPLAMYYFLFCREQRYAQLFLAVTLLSAGDVLLCRINPIQMAAVLAVPLIAFIQKAGMDFRVPRPISYCAYPASMMAAVILKAI